MLQFGKTPEEIAKTSMKTTPECNRVHLHNYTIGKKIGEGSYGQVLEITYNVVGPDFGTKAALKIIRFVRSIDVDSFFTEVSIMERASEIGVGPDVAAEGYRKCGKKYGHVIMEYLKPVDASKEKPGDLLRRIFVTMQKMHDGGIWHNDAYMRNVMMSQDNTPVFVDYGFALLYDDIAGVPLPLRYTDMVGLVLGHQRHGNLVAGFKGVGEPEARRIMREVLGANWDPDLYEWALKSKVTAGKLGLKIQRPLNKSLMLVAVEYLGRNKKETMTESAKRLIYNNYDSPLFAGVDFAQKEAAPLPPKYRRPSGYRPKRS